MALSPFSAFFSKRKYLTLLLVLGMLGVSACDTLALYTTGAQIAHKTIWGEPVNVKAKSYAAADYMDQSLRVWVDKNTMVGIQPLYIIPNEYGQNINDLVYTIPYQVGERWSYLGYNVDLQSVSDLPNTGVVNTGLHSAKYVLTGTVLPKARLLNLYREVLVDLNVKEVQTGRIVSSFSYVLPKKPKSNDENRKDIPRTLEDTQEYNRKRSPFAYVKEVVGVAKDEWDSGEKRTEPGGSTTPQAVQNTNN